MGTEASGKVEGRSQAGTVKTFGSDLPHDHAGLVEVGFVVAGAMAEAGTDAICGAAQDLYEMFSERFGEFHWRISVINRPEPETDGAKRAETSALLRLANRERANAHWDFAFAVTARDLHAYYRDRAFAAPSRALDCGVISLARLAPEAGGLKDGDVLRHRIGALVLHLFGHLNMLDHRPDPQNYMFAFNEAPDLDRMQLFSEEDTVLLHTALARVADERIEEQHLPRAPLFYLRAIWANRHDLAEAVLRAKPWMFPFLFSRMTTAAFSTLLVLSITAEAWELGMTRPPGLVALISIAVLFGTSIFILVRQQLLPRQGPRHLSEQRVVVSTAATVILLWGMATVYALLFAASLTVGFVLISEDLAHSWAPSLSGEITVLHYVTMAGMSSALGTFAGALGASFEGNSYFRHVVFIDEET